MNLKLVRKYFSNIDSWKKILIIGTLCGFVLFHAFLLSKTLIIDNEGALRTTPVGFGDIPYHLSQVTFFSHPVEKLEEPIFKGEKFQYPFAVNFLSGTLLRVTDNLRFSFLFPVMIFAAFNVVLLYLLFKKTTRNRLLALIGIFLFFFACGWNAYPKIKEARMENLSPKQFIEHLREENSIMTLFGKEYPDQNIVYGPPLFMFFMHQRAFLPGLTLFLSLALSLFSFFEKRKKIFLILAILSYGALPIFHTHSFVAATIFLCSFWIFKVWNKDWENAKKLLLIICVGTLIALPQLLYLTGHKLFPAKETFPSLRLGWMVNGGFGSIQFPPGPHFSFLSFLKFEWLNFGLLIVAFLAGALYLFFKKDKEEPGKLSEKLFMVGTFLVVLANIVQFQAWDFDNNKIFLYAELLIIPLMLVMLSKLYDKSKALGILVGFIFILLLTSGGTIESWILLQKSTKELPVIFTKEAVELSEFVKDTISPNSTIVTGTTHRNPIASLSGIPVLVGYPGWLWTRAIDYSRREKELKDFYKNPAEHMSLLSKYRATYVLFDKNVEEDFEAKKTDFDFRFKTIFKNNEFTLYKVN